MESLGVKLKSLVVKVKFRYLLAGKTLSMFIIAISNIKCIAVEYQKIITLNTFVM